MATKAYIIVSFIFLMYSQFCGQNRDYYTYNKLNGDKMEMRDSLLIMYTLNEWTKANWNAYNDESRLYKMKREDTKFWIGAIFYSPDKTKMIAWIGTKEPNVQAKESSSSNPENDRLCPGGPDTIYGLRAVISIREHANQQWTLFPLDNYKVFCARSKEEATYWLSNYFFKDMADDATWVKITKLDTNYGGKLYDDSHLAKIPGKERDTVYVMKHYGYALKDKEFWNKSLLWQKGACLKDHYLFEQVGLFELWTEQTGPSKFPEINYPEEITKLYEK